MLTRVDEGLELALHHTTTHLHSADLRDRVVGGQSRRLQVDDAERHLGQRRAEVVERGLQVC